MSTRFSMLSSLGKGKIKLPPEEPKYKKSSAIEDKETLCPIVDIKGRGEFADFLDTTFQTISRIADHTLKVRLKCAVKATDHEGSRSSETEQYTKFNQSLKEYKKQVEALEKAFRQPDYNTDEAGDVSKDQDRPEIG